MDNSMRFIHARLLLVALAVLLACQAGGAQSYSRGQNASPAFEGFEENPDGSFSFLFGYMNRNWEEEIDVPVGPDNNIEPGGPDQGQPTHFLPRRNRFIFKVRVPKDFGEKEMVWTLTIKGKTEKAYATLRTDYRIDNVVVASETGALGAGTSSPEVRANIPPVAAIEGEHRRTVRVGQPLNLVTLVTDDGVPRRRGQPSPSPGSSPQTSRPTDPGNPVPQLGGRGRNPAYSPPSRITVGKANGLHLSWFVYRGSGKVTFDPPQVKVWEDTRAGANSPWAPLWQPPALPRDGKWIAQATFDEPGTYVLRARADDGALYHDQELTVTVPR
jgi:hypothetical protein